MLTVEHLILCNIIVKVLTLKNIYLWGFLSWKNHTIVLCNMRKNGAIAKSLLDGNMPEQLHVLFPVVRLVLASSGGNEPVEKKDGMACSGVSIDGSKEIGYEIFGKAWQLFGSCVCLEWEVKFQRYQDSPARFCAVCLGVAVPFTVPGLRHPRKTAAGRGMRRKRKRKRERI